MKINSGLFSLALAGFTALAASQPHGIKHRHVARNNVQIVTEVTTQYVTVTGTPPTSTASAIPSKIPAVDISVEDVEEDVSSNSSSVAYSVAPTVVSSVASSPTVSVPSASHSSSATTSDDNTYNLSIDPITGKGVDSNPNTGKDFPDGTIDCDQFPSDYGPIQMTWVTKQGWSGIQVGNSNADSIGECTEGALCSYACPAGFSKSQWPSDQPSDGQSRGGLLCKGGKLHLTRPSYTQLCQAGAGGVTVVNKLSQSVSICRTDYPGSENMVVPLSCSAGSTKDLTVPDATNSYVWQGMSTSAQYYVNKAGIDIKDGCTWGQAGQGLGNWSPMIFGAGQSNGMKWLSISQNSLNSAPLGFNVEIKGGNSECWYKNGKFSSGTGCTTAVPSGGSATYVLTPCDN